MINDNLLSKAIRDRKVGKTIASRFQERLDEISLEMVPLEEKVISFMRDHIFELEDCRYDGTQLSWGNLLSGCLTVNDVTVDTRWAEFDRNGDPIVEKLEKGRYALCLISEGPGKRLQIRCGGVGGNCIARLHRLNVLKAVLGEPVGSNYKTIKDLIDLQFEALPKIDRVAVVRSLLGKMDEPSGVS